MQQSEPLLAGMSMSVYWNFKNLPLAVRLMKVLQNWGSASWTDLMLLFI